MNIFQRGIGMVEIIVGSAVFLSFFIVLMTGYARFIEETAGNIERTQATFLIEEGLEVARLIRDNDWTSFSTLSTTTPHYLVYSGNQWIATTTPVLVETIFSRSMTISDVRRDGNSNIATTGTVDPKIKKVTINVSWNKKNATTTKSVSTYLADLR